MKLIPKTVFVHDYNGQFTVTKSCKVYDSNVKELKDKYCLSKEELIDIIGKAWDTSKWAIEYSEEKCKESMTIAIPITTTKDKFITNLFK